MLTRLPSGVPLMRFPPSDRITLNAPLVNYYEHGTFLTLNHAHTALFGAFGLLGLASAATSACCTLPALGLLVGYSGAQGGDRRKGVLKPFLYFTLGIVLSLMVLGGIAGFVGQVAQASLGRYWKAFAGVVSVVLGLAALELLPFRLILLRRDHLRVARISLNRVRPVGGLLERAIDALGQAGVPRDQALYARVNPSWKK